METQFRKGREGWEARTKFPMPELTAKGGVLHTEGDAQLSVSTSKHSGGVLSTCVSVAWVHDGMETFVIFGDFMVWPIKEKVRCTESSVRDQHTRALAQIDAYKAQAVGFYARKMVGSDDAGQG